jgi:hypothetical protein
MRSITCSKSVLFAAIAQKLGKEGMAGLPKGIPKGGFCKRNLNLTATAQSGTVLDFR